MPPATTTQPTAPTPGSPEFAPPSLDTMGVSLLPDGKIDTTGMSVEAWDALAAARGQDALSGSRPAELLRPPEPSPAERARLAQIEADRVRNELHAQAVAAQNARLAVQQAQTPGAALPPPTNPMNRQNVRQAVQQTTPPARQLPPPNSINQRRGPQQTQVSQLGVPIAPRTPLSQQELDEIKHSYFDRYGVFDKDGNQLYDLDTRQPLDIRTMHLDRGVSVFDAAGNPVTDENLAGIKEISEHLKAREGVPLGKRLKSKAWAIVRGHYGTEGVQATRNAMENKIVQDTITTGPDDDERIVFSTVSAGGKLQKYDGTPLNAKQIALYHQQVRNAKHNVSMYQGRAAYEIGKLEEQEQAAGWMRIVNIMYQKLGYSEAQIMGTIVGLQFMKKASYLTFKHRGIEHPVMTDPNTGQPIMHNGKPRLDTTRYVFGKLKERAYATELADKFKPYEMTFGSGDVAEVLRLAKNVSERVEAGLKDTPEARADRKRKSFLDAIYVLHKLKATVDSSRMTQSDLEATEKNMAQRQILAQQAAQRPMEYPARLGASSAEANSLWAMVANVVDRTSDGLPFIKATNVDDYPRISELEH